MGYYYCSVCYEPYEGSDNGLCRNGHEEGLEGCGNLCPDCTNLIDDDDDYGGCELCCSDEDEDEDEDGSIAQKLQAKEVAELTAKLQAAKAKLDNMKKGGKKKVVKVAASKAKPKAKKMAKAKVAASSKKKGWQKK